MDQAQETICLLKLNLILGRQPLEKEQIVVLPKRYNSNSLMIIKVDNLIIQYKILERKHIIKDLNQKELHGRIHIDLRNLITILILNLIMLFLKVEILN